MVTSTAVLVRYQDPDDLAERTVVAGFLAGYTGSTRVSYTTDLRLFAEWCAGNGVRLLTVKRGHVELFARHMEADGRMRSTVARRLSTLASFYRYCHVEGLLRRNPAAGSPPVQTVDRWPFRSRRGRGRLRPDRLDRATNGVGGHDVFLPRATPPEGARRGRGWGRFGCGIGVLGRYGIWVITSHEACLSEPVPPLPRSKLAPPSRASLPVWPRSTSLPALP